MTATVTVALAASAVNANATAVATVVQIAMEISAAKSYFTLTPIAVYSVCYGIY